MSVGVTVEKLFQDEFDKKTKQLQDDLSTAKQRGMNLQRKLWDYEKENKELIKLSKEIEQLKTIKEIVNETNIEEVLNVFQLKHSGVKVERIEEKYKIWFKLLIVYYPSKDKLFNLLDLFEIEYPEWAKNFKMPYDYNEDELTIFVNNMHKNVNWNGNAFSSNMGYFAETVVRCQADLKKMMTSSSSPSIPWNHLLVNPLLVKDRFFDKVVDHIKQQKKNYEYLFSITKYQQLSHEQIEKLFNLLPAAHKLKEFHKRFIEDNVFMLKDKPHIAEVFRNEMTHSYDSFNYKKFPILMQIDYIKHNGSFEEKLKMLRELEIPSAEKRKVYAEVLDKEFI